jgi:hypothetical protein
MAHDKEFRNPDNTIASQGYPSPFVDPKVKESKAYGLRYFKAMYDEYEQDTNMNTNESMLDRFITNRKYAEGLQDVDKYKDLLANDGDNSYLNLDWSVISVIPKFVEVLVGGLINQEYKIQCNAIDPMSQSNKDKERRKLVANMELKQFSDEVEEVTGIPIVPKDAEIFGSQEEIDLHMQMNYKQDVEISMEQALEFVFYNNDWDESRKRVIRDIITLKRAGFRTSRDVNGDLRVRYVDPANLVTSYTNDPSHKGVRHAGELIQLTIAELRQIAGNYFSEKDYFDIAKSFAGNGGNRNWAYGNNYYSRANGGTRDGAYDDFLITILDAEFYSTNRYVYEKKSNNYGGYYFQRRDYGYKLPDKSKQKRELVEKDIKCVYKGMWIVGSEHIFDYGLKPNMVREKINGKYSTDTTLSFHIYAPDIYDMENKSLVEKMIPFADQMQLVHLKIQQLLGKARPPGLAVDVSGLSNVLKGMGEDGWKPLDIQNMYDQLGTYYFSSIRDDGTPIANSNPIQELQNGIGSDLERLVGVYNYNLQEIRNVTGVNEVRDASAPDKDSLVGVDKMRLMASNNATRTVNDSYLKLMEMTAKDLSLMIQDNIENGIGIEGYYSAVGEQKVKTIKITGKDVSLAEIGIKIEALPDAEEKAYIEQNIQASLSAQELRLEDAIVVRRVAKSNVKLAEQVMLLRRKKYQEEKMMESQAAAQANAEQQAMAAQQKAQADAMKAQADAQAKMAVLEKEYALKQQLAAQEHEQEMKQIALENEYKNEQIIMASQENFKNTQLSKEAPQPKVFSKPPTATP